MQTTGIKPSTPCAACSHLTDNIVYSYCFLADAPDCPSNTLPVTESVKPAVEAMIGEIRLCKVNSILTDLVETLIDVL